MNIAISTGTFYHVPFHKTLEMIKKSGFDYIELLPYWEGGDSWAMGQHLKNISPKESLKIIKECGLKISSLHDGGGVIEVGKNSIVAKSTFEFLEYGENDIPCIVFHVPHKKTDDIKWYDAYRVIVGDDLRAIKNKIICIENLPNFDGFAALSSEPCDLLEFSKENEIYITIDTTHYAEMGIDIIEAAKILKERVRTVHLSDYLAPKRHVFVGEGILDLRGFINQLDISRLHAVTIECDIEYHEDDTTKTVERLTNALNYTKSIISIPPYHVTKICLCKKLHKKLQEI